MNLKNTQVKYMAVGNAVKVTHKTDSNFGNIGVIEEVCDTHTFDFVIVDFGVTKVKYNTCSLLDITYQHHENNM